MSLVLVSQILDKDDKMPLFAFPEIGKDQRTGLAVMENSVCSLFFPLGAVC